MYTKLYWAQGGWAILKNASKPYRKKFGKKYGMYIKGDFVCGSRRGFKDSGKEFVFQKWSKIELLEEVDELIKKELIEHFEVFL